MARKPQPLGPISRQVILQARESLMALILVACEGGTLSRSSSPETNRSAIEASARGLLARLEATIHMMPEFDTQ